MTIVEDLVANPGLYVGIDEVAGTDHRGVARILVTPLPGTAGVSLDYEVLVPGMPDRVLAHVEHTIIGRTEGGGAVMVIGHTHSETITVLRETEPGVFELAGEPSPYPMKVVVTVPAPGRMRHAWWYGMPGEDLAERDVAEVALQP